MFLPTGASPEKPTAITSNIDDANVIASIDFGGAMHGTVCLAAPVNVALSLAEALSGHQYDLFEGDAKDGFGEIANLIIGGVSTRLAKDVGIINITPPSVMLGSDHQDKFKNRSSMLKQVFNSESGPFTIVFLPK